MSLEVERRKLYNDYGLDYPEGGLKTAKSGQQQIADFFGGLWNDFTGKTNNQMNLDFQRENLDYQKAIQQQIFQREDTAYQRTINDMRASGLNPLSMNGTNGAGEAIATTPLNSEKTSDLQAFSMVLNVLNQVSNTLNNNSLARAQSNLVNQQANSQKIKNIFESDILSNTLEGLNLQNIGKRFQNEISSIDRLGRINNLNFNLANGLTDNMPDSVKLALLTTGNKSYSTKFRYNSNKSWNDFGNGFDFYENDPYFDMDSSKLHGAIIENKIIDGLLNLLNRIPLTSGK